MAGYATEGDFVSLGLPESVRLRAAAKGISVALHLTAQARFMDTFFADRAYVPLSPFDENIVDKNCALAAWTVLCVIGFNPKDPAEVAVLTRYNQAIAWLEDVRDHGAPILGGGVVAPAPAGESAVVRVATGALRGWDDA